MQRILALAAAAAIGLGLAGGVAAQMPGHGQHGATTPAAAGEAEKAYREANARMHKGMEIKYTGDADKDFVAGMIAHHQGAIDMAKVVLRYGKDPEIRTLAETIIKDQEREVAQMKAWQAKKK